MIIELTDDEAEILYEFLEHDYDLPFPYQSKVLRTILSQLSAWRRTHGDV